MFALTLVLLTLVGVIGILGITDVFKALGRHMTFNAHQLRADDVKWPFLRIITRVYILLLALLTMQVSIDTITHGCTYSTLNLFIGILLCVVDVLCIKIIVTSRYADDLLITAPSVQMCTCCVPLEWNGVPVLLVRRMKDG